ncbi:hypothetical protein [Helicobacter pullorum]|uniref:Uncharacterized protein n=1 Tax=Helicobacter pullorum TaxID=35818 RepID=A0A0N1EBJ4_9HELI|nr:hypothetical protein [Helicobacter pullorum]KPH54753.1 hypothetical protein HPU229334_00220 [Helicobacter pullorum]HJF82924.1 hypothetical protein [Helicobacter pullorum]
MFDLLNAYNKMGITDALKSSSVIYDAGGLGMNAGSQMANNAGMLDSLGGLGGIGAGINGIANLVGGIGGIVNARKQLKEQKRAIDLMQNQYNIENQRYNERMAIHDKAANAINDSADYFNRD